MLAGGCQIAGGGFVWSGGLERCPVGHGCWAPTRGLETALLCIIQNYNNQRPESPAWCTAPGSWAASHLPGQLPGRWGCCSDSWHILSSRLCNTSMGTTSSVDITPKINKVMFTLTPPFLRAGNLRLRTKSLVQSHPETKEHRVGILCTNPVFSLSCPHCAVRVHTLMCMCMCMCVCVCEMLRV